MSASHHLTGRFTLDLPPDTAFRLFTPRGEANWVTGWHPEFPAPTDDDTAPGTVFRTAHDTTWVVTGCERPHRIAYAQLRPGERAGTVTVTIADTGTDTGRACAVTVTYRLTALRAAARPELDRFAADYPAFLESWRDAITTRMW
jgi:hypothetical protein